MVLADVWNVISEALISFVVGVAVGLRLASRYRLMRINGRKRDE